MKLSIQLLALLLTCSFLSCTEKKSGEPAENKNVVSDSIPKPASVNTANPYAPIDVSPMDMSYFPVDFPKLKMAHNIQISPLARVIYSRPHLQGRHLFHEVLKYDEAWRLGANESTELQLFKSATIQGRKIPAGRYVLYCIPQPDSWTIVLNSDLDCWGLKQDTTKDIAKFDVPVKKTENHLEYFTMVFEKVADGAELVMAWDNIEARLPVRF